MHILDDVHLIGSEILALTPSRSSAQTQGQQVTILENSSVLVQLEAIVDRKLEKYTTAVLFGETLRSSRSRVRPRHVTICRV